VKRKAKGPKPISGYVVNADAVATAMLRDQDARRLLFNVGARIPAGFALRRGV
jgi:hypothetical protein